MLFRISRPDLGVEPVTYVFSGTANRGAPMSASTTDATKCVLATATGFVGHVTRPVDATGPTELEHLRDTYGTGLTESNYKSGDTVAVERPLEIEVAGDEYMVTSGTGALADDTAVGTKLGFTSGLLREQQEGDDAVYQLMAHLGDDDDGDFIIRCQRV